VRYCALLLLLWICTRNFESLFLSTARSQLQVGRHKSLTPRGLFWGSEESEAVATNTVAAPTWEELLERLELVQTPDEKAFRQNLDMGSGPPTAMANLRFFNKNADEAQKVTLYRDSASWCPYCHKVWMLLEEKRIPYNVGRVNMNCYGDKPAEFLQKQPSGTLPAAVIDGRTFGTSDSIIDRVLRMSGESSEIDDAIDPVDDPRTNGLLALDQVLGGAWLSCIRGGGSVSRFTSMVQKVEEALAEDDSGPYFLGSRFSLIDIMYTPYFEREVASLMYFKGFNMRDRERYPAITAWLDAMESRPSVRASKSDYYTHSHDLPPQLGGCDEEASGAKARADVDGNAWQFPLRSDLTEPDWPWISPAEARREAAERLSNRPKAVAHFAARGGSSAGFPPVWAELSDPNAKPARELVPSVDALLRHTMAMLLAGDEAADNGDDSSPERAAAWSAAQEAVASVPAGSRERLANCLEYLQRRIGVPRDMSLPAARRLRAELGKLINVLRA